jgi:trans-aconitate methyltransferase
MKPAAWSKDRAESFLDEDAVRAYHNRAPYPPEVFNILAGLVTDEPRAVLDAGCGSGAICRFLAPKVARVDAVDPSAAMIAAGKLLPGGDDPHIRWIEGTAEEAPLQPPYALITAGMSIHWMEWELALPRFASILTPNGYLAMLYNTFTDMPWQEEVRELRRQVRGHEYPRPTASSEVLEQDGLFKKIGEKKTAPIVFKQMVDEFIEQHHSRSDMARVKIGTDAAAHFDAKLRSILAKYVTGDEIEMQITAEVVWGKPLCR